MRIRRKFLQLTKRTFPHGTESRLIDYLPKGYSKDAFGNYFLQIGESTSVMFTCHLDTACSYNQAVVHKFNGNFVTTNGDTILGADDKAGMTILLYMIEKKIPGLYYFFIGEEVGCIGSSRLSCDFKFEKINKVVSFDRRGTKSVITHQLMGRCCSDEFAQELCSRLNSTNQGLSMELDDGGVLTDSAQFMEIVPECTNISVGYYGEHTNLEKQDLDFLGRICRAVVNINWETLPVKRDPSEFDESSFYGMFRTEDFTRTKKIRDDSDPFFHTDMSGYREYDKNYFTYILQEGISKKMYLSQTWINHETLIIFEYLKRNVFLPKEINWDGTSCWAHDGTKLDYIGNRSELISMIPSLSKIPAQHLRENIPVIGMRDDIPFY